MSLPWIMLFLLLQVFLVLLASASGSFSQTVNNLALSEVCRYTSGAGNARMEEVKNNRETFREHEEYAIEWDVTITKGQDAADEIADRLGFINDGPVSRSYSYCCWVKLLQISQNDGEEVVYKFVLDEDEVKLMPRYEPYEIKTQLLMMEENVRTYYYFPVHMCMIFLAFLQSDGSSVLYSTFRYCLQIRKQLT